MYEGLSIALKKPCFKSIQEVSLWRIGETSWIDFKQGGFSSAIDRSSIGVTSPLQGSSYARPEQWLDFFVTQDENQYEDVSGQKKNEKIISSGG